MELFNKQNTAAETPKEPTATGAPIPAAEGDTKGGP